MRIYQLALDRYKTGLATGQFNHLLRAGDGTPFLRIVVP
jgi:hypothetical protein